MSVEIVEIKAKSRDHEAIRAIIRQHPHRDIGTDLQIDTYYTVPRGRLKLRRGNIENTLIFYNRPDTASAKTSRVELFRADNLEEIKSLLDAAFDQLVEVVKQREIYFIENVKFHLDTVEKLGTFVEIEAIDEDGSIGEANLRKQCNHYLQLLQIRDSELITHSYSDLILGRP